MASIWDIGDYIYDTFTGGKKTTDRSAEEIEDAGKEYREAAERIAANTKGAKELYDSGKQIAAGQANNKAGLAAKKAKAAAMQTSGSKLLSAIQGAEAANAASAEGYDNAADKAAGLEGSVQQARNDALLKGAQAQYQSKVDSANMRAKQAQDRAARQQQMTATLGQAFLSGLDK